MNQINTRYHSTQIGEVILGSFRGKLCLLDFREENAREMVDDRIRLALNAELVEQDDEILRQTRRQLDEYLEGQRKEFDIPVLMVGTDFQKDVWKAVMRVPYGATSTYSQIARDIGKGRAVRAVGNAMAANPIVIIIPCHRIIGSGGMLGGYGGGLSLKRRLLALESRNALTLDALNEGAECVGAGHPSGREEASRAIQGNDRGFAGLEADGGVNLPGSRAIHAFGGNCAKEEDEE